MKASKLIAILAEHVSENGDFEVVMSPADPTQQYQPVKYCWYNYGQTWEQEDRIILSSGAAP